MASLSKLKPNLSRVLMGAALTVSATAVINAGESKAVDYTCFLSDITANNGKCNNQIGDKKFSTFALTGYAPDPSDRIDFSEAGGQWVVSTNFGGQTSVPALGTLSYTVVIDPAFPLQKFDRVEVNSDSNTINGGAATVTNSISNVAASPLVTTGGSVGPVAFNANTTTTNISSAFITTGAATFNNFSVKFTQTPTFVRQGVPGPLPLLGAGAAFAFSRRIRRRIKAFA